MRRSFIGNTCSFFKSIALGCIKRNEMTDTAVRSTTSILKTPKGTRDFNDRESALMRKILNTTEEVFKIHGAVSIDTPVIELKEILTGKYGEESKLIYDLAEQGGESCSLRYDFTVPLARYAAQHGVKKIKRYQIGKVFRRDQPNISQGRMREFYQCDFDIVGLYKSMVPEAECLNTIHNTISSLKINNFYIKINHRSILDGIFEISGVPLSQIRSVSSCIDKLDKRPWEEIQNEMLSSKGISQNVALNIKKYVLIKSNGINEICNHLENDPDVIKNTKITTAINEMRVLHTYLAAYSIDDKIKFDLSLARGLDYYTGVIFEALVIDDDPDALKSLGSIAGGGRYDNLIKKLSGSDTNCIGFSIGCERIFSYLCNKIDINKVKPCSTKVLVAGLGNIDFKEVLKLSNELRLAGIHAETLMKSRINIQSYFAYSEKYKIPFIIFLGSKELETNIYKVKCTIKELNFTEPFEDLSLNRSELVPKLKEVIEKYRNISDDTLESFYSS